MPKADDSELAALLYSALAEPIGLLCAAAPSFEVARARLYAARKRLGDPELERLQFRASPFPEGNLVIVKETVKLGESEAHGSPE